ncbi:MAG: hypothetical protein ACR2OR_09765 [Hyphomicrobiales bacterium]
MPAKFLSIVIFLILYAGICLVSSFVGSRKSSNPRAFAICDSALSNTLFGVGFTASLFAGWLVVSHPGKIYLNGIPYAAVSFFVIIAALSCAVLFPRLWRLSRQYGFTTPGEVFAQYFRAEGFRLLVAFITLIFSILFLALGLKAAGDVLSVLSDETLAPRTGIIIIGVFLFAFAALGGLYAVVRAGGLNLVLLVCLVVSVCAIAMSYVGSWQDFTNAMAALAKADEIRTPDGASHYFSYSGILAADSEDAGWSMMRALTSVLAYAGLIASPAYLMWSFAPKSQTAFAPQQLFGTALFLGALMFGFMVTIGFAGHFLGANLLMNDAASDHVYNVLAASLGAGDILEHPAGANALVPLLINLLGQTGSSGEAAFAGFLAMCAIAAILAAGIAVLHFSSVILASDGLLRPVNSSGTRIAATLITAGAIAIAASPEASLAGTADFVLAAGFQMWPAVLAVCYVKSFTRQGVAAGMVLGLLVAFTTSKTGLELPWGPSPFGVHPAIWGGLVNFAVVALLSPLTDRREAHTHRHRFHNVIDEGLEQPARDERGLLVIAAVAAGWMFFAAGPGALIGETLFGAPEERENWIFSLPSLWAWQIGWWLVGVFVVWLAAYRLGASTTKDLNK